MKRKTLASIIALSVLSTSMIQAKTQENVKTIYETMTTEQIQIEVEKHSKLGTLSFALGLELMKRWTKS